MQKRIIKMSSLRTINAHPDEVNNSVLFYVQRIKMF